MTITKIGSIALRLDALSYWLKTALLLMSRKHVMSMSSRDGISSIIRSPPSISQGCRTTNRASRFREPSGWSGQIT